MTITTEMIAGALSFSITLLLAYILFYWVWQSYVIDSTRQQIFEFRDRLFDMATAGELERGSEVYLELRISLNKAIRFADELDIVRLLLMVFTANRIGVPDGSPHVEKMYRLISSIPNNSVRGEVLSIFEKSNRVMVWHVYRRSLALLILVPAIALPLSLILVSTEDVVAAVLTGVTTTACDAMELGFHQSASMARRVALKLPLHDRIEARVIVGELLLELNECVFHKLVLTNQGVIGLDVVCQNRYLLSRDTAQ